MCDCCENNLCIKKTQHTELNCECENCESKKLQCSCNKCSRVAEIEIKCAEFNIDFSKPCSSLIKHPTKIIYKVDDKFILMVYGFAVSENSSCQSHLCIKTDSRNNCDNGIYLSCKDSDRCVKHFIQIDLGDYIRIKNLKCPLPKIRIGGSHDKFYIYGSNKLGVLGHQLNINKSEKKCVYDPAFIIPSFNTTDFTEYGDLSKYGVIPFRYIGIMAHCGTNVCLNSLCFYLC
jgi:hypothetical protein